MRPATHSPTRTVSGTKHQNKSKFLLIAAATFALAGLTGMSGIVGGSLPAQAAPAPVPAAARHGMLGIRLPEVKLQGNALSDAIDFMRDVSGANIHVNWRALEAAGVSKDTPVNLRLRDVPLRRALNLILSEAGGGVALTYYVDQGVVEITTKELADKDTFTRVYPIDDLIMDIPDFDQVPNFDLNAVSTGGSSSGGGGGSRSGRSGGSSGGGGGGGGGGGSLFGNSGAQTKEKVKTKTERAEDIVNLIRETVYPEVWRENGGPASIRFFNGMLIVTAPRSVHEALGGEVD